MPRSVGPEDLLGELMLLRDFLIVEMIKSFFNCEDIITSEIPELLGMIEG